jgi:hypothetical protein
MLAALLNARTAVAQTVTLPAASAAPIATSGQTVGMADARFTAPIGHRQPRAQDVGSAETAIVGRIDDDSAALDRKLRICRGC